MKSLKRISVSHLQDLEKEKRDADVNYIKNRKDQLDQMKVNPDKFEVSLTIL